MTTTTAQLTPQQIDPRISDKFSEWRPGQQLAYERIRAALASANKFTGVLGPVGVGKSLLYVLASAGYETDVLTPNKHLQDQLLTDFGGGTSRADRIVLDVRGAQNYTCADPAQPRNTRADNAACQSGYRCPVAPADCAYLRSKVDRRAWDGTVVTNYAMRISSQRLRLNTPTGRPRLLVLDEAHTAGEWLMEMSVKRVPQALCDELSVKLRAHPCSNWAEWRRWAAKLGRGKPDADERSVFESELAKYDAVVAQYHDAGRPASRHVRDKRNAYADAVDALRTIANSPERWAAEYSVDKRTAGWTFTPLFPYQVARPMFADYDRVLLLSGTLTEYDLDMLGINSDERDELIRLPDPFDAARAPVMFIPSTKVRHGMSKDEKHVWRAAIDSVVVPRLEAGRKGLILTTSYNQANDYYNWAGTGVQSRLIIHGPGQLPRNLERFKQAADARVLLTPAIDVGVDFPDDECRFIIIAKVPYPYLAPGTANRARAMANKSWTRHVAMVTLQQMAGRGMRHPDDWCEVFIIDDAWNAPGNGLVFKGWEFATEWFQARCRAGDVRMLAARNGGGSA